MCLQKLRGVGDIEKQNMLKQHYMPLFLVSYFLFLLPLGSLSAEIQAIPRKLGLNNIFYSQESKKYAVIFDAGSTGSRVHVFGFDPNMDLIRIGDAYSFFRSIKPGLSAYGDDPEDAALSLQPLLEQAESIVPELLRPSTPLRLGATAGLRMLKGDAPERILQAVRDLFKNGSLEYKPDWVSILDGSDEAIYLWTTINYLWGRIGKTYKQTIGTIDLGGGSVQMTYAISQENAAKAPQKSNEGGVYVHEKYPLGTKYYIYGYSYLYYGQLAARAENFKVTRNSSNPCILDGYDGFFTYGGVVYKASSPPSGSSMKKCRHSTLKALKVNAPCEYKNCTFKGIWNGGGGEGQKNIVITSFFNDIAIEGGIKKPNELSTKVRPIDFKNAAKIACATKYQDVKSKFPNVFDKDMPYLCMDLVYDYTLLVDGFGLDPYKKVSLVSQVEYKNTLVGAAWPLGCAVDLVSRLTKWRTFIR